MEPLYFLRYRYVVNAMTLLGELTHVAKNSSMAIHKLGLSLAPIGYSITVLMICYYSFLSHHKNVTFEDDGEEKLKSLTIISLVILSVEILNETFSSPFYNIIDNGIKASLILFTIWGWYYFLTIKIKDNE